MLKRFREIVPDQEFISYDDAEKNYFLAKRIPVEGMPFRCGRCGSQWINAAEVYGATPGAISHFCEDEKVIPFTRLEDPAVRFDPLEL